MKIVYSPKYNIKFLGLENLHPFDSKKYGRTWNVLKKRFGRDLKKHTVSPEKPVDERQLLSVHTLDYLKGLGDSGRIAELLEMAEVSKFPIMLVDRLLLQPMRWACAGSILGASEAMKCGLAVNLGGGYHHAGTSYGGGFCIYSDIALAIAHLRESELLEPREVVAYVDLDAHQGDGVSHTYMDDSRVQLFDMYNHLYFPNDEQAIDRIDWDVPVDNTWSSEDYMVELKKRLPEFLNALAEESKKVGFAIYNAGTDIFETDPLGGMAVTAEHILQRDLFVIEQLRSRNIPTLMLLSGGYTMGSYQLVADSVSEFLRNEW